MRTEFHVTGSERKRLVQTIARSTGEKARYLGMPSMAYEIGPFTVTGDGALEFGDRTDPETVRNLYRDLAAAGFSCALPELPEEGSGAEPEGEPCGVGLTVMVPADTMTEEAMKNLDSILAAKGHLIRKALGIGNLPVIVEGERVIFPWFEDEQLTTAEVHAYTRFVSALCELARNRKRINAKEKETENDKYSFRCFLLSLGFIGPEFKNERKILLGKLSGSSAFRNGGAQHVLSE